MRTRPIEFCACAFVRIKSELGVGYIVMSMTDRNRNDFKKLTIRTCQPVRNSNCSHPAIAPKLADSHMGPGARTAGTYLIRASDQIQEILPAAMPPRTKIQLRAR